jgi:hypothetical protein
MFLKMYDRFSKIFPYAPVILLIGCFSFFLSDLNAQSDSCRFLIKIENYKNYSSFRFTKKIKDTFSFSDFRLQIRDIKSELNESGYFNASFSQSEDCTNDFCIIQINPGKRYEWTILKNGNIPKELFNSVGLKEDIFKDKKFNYREFGKMQDLILTSTERNGYPFAMLWLDSLKTDSNFISAALFLDYGPEIFMDSIRIEGKSSEIKKSKLRISKKYLENYLDIKRNSLYDESNILKIKKKLTALPFLNSFKDPQVIFKGNKATPCLFIESRNASKFDVLFGLLPSVNPTTKQQQFNFTGNVNIDLLNSFGRGERLYANWQQFQQGRSELRLGFSYPYLFNIPLEINSNFELYRRDSTYIDIITEVGLSYLFDGNNYVKLFWNNSSTNVQNPDTSYVLQFKKLPAIQDLRTNSLGIEYYNQKLNYRWNPTKGFELKALATIGFKYTKPNVQILSLNDSSQPDFDFSSLYDSVSTNSIQFRGSLSYSHFFQLYKKLTLMARYRTSVVLNNNNQLYVNELYRVGGQQTIRGFDEQSIFADWFQIATTEIRFLTGKNSFIYLFGDLSSTQNILNTYNNLNYRYGFGAGIALETKVGIFGLSYALGSSFNDPLLLRNGKVHFGYLNMF